MGIYNGRLAHIDEAELRRYAGIQKLASNAEANQQMAGPLARAMKEALILAEPRATYERYVYDKQNHCVLTPQTNFCLEGKSIRKHLQQAEQVFIVAVTVGEAIEVRASELFASGDYTVATLLDVAATTAVEQVADQVNDLLVKQADKLGYKTTWRFSPGYGDWPLTAQHEMLKLSKASQIGLSLTESLMLMPRKSVTAIIGLIPREAVTDDRRECKSCTQRNCMSRKI